MATIICMYCIRKYRRANGQIPFDEWFNAIKDKRVKTRLLKRLKKVQLGNLCDWNFAGDGVFELREHFNQGFRIYYGMEKQTVILLLCGGEHLHKQKISVKRGNIGANSKKVIKDAFSGIQDQ